MSSIFATILCDYTSGQLLNSGIALIVYEISSTNQLITFNHELYVFNKGIVQKCWNALCSQGGGILCSWYLITYMYSDLAKGKYKL